MKFLAKKSIANERKEHNIEKYVQWDFVIADSTGLGPIFIRLTFVGSQICEI